MNTEQDTVATEPNGQSAVATPRFASPYLNAEEAAAYMRTTVQGVYSLVKRRKIRAMPGRPGRLLFTRAALDKYLNGK